MNILEIVFSSSWGGLEMQVCRLTKAFADRGHKVIMIAPEGSEIARNCKENNIKTLTFSPSIKYLAFVTARKIAKVIRDKNIDIIHLHASKDLSTAILAKKFARKGKIVFSQHMDSRFDKNDIFHKWIYKNTDNIVAVTRSMAEHIFSYTPAKINQIKHIYNGVDIEEFQPCWNEGIYKKLDLKVKGPVVGIVGRLDRGKNQELLIKAAPLVLEKYPFTVFVIIGSETKDKAGFGYRAYLENKVKQNELEKSFRILEYVDNIKEFSGSFNVTVLTTPKETFGLVLIESMAMGIPVIGTNSGGVPEIIDDGANGFLYEPNNHEQLAEGILKLLKSEELRNSFGKKAIKKVKNQFDFQKKVSEYEMLFRELTVKEVI